LTAEEAVRDGFSELSGHWYLCLGLAAALRHGTGAHTLLLKIRKAVENNRKGLFSVKSSVVGKYVRCDLSVCVRYLWQLAKRHLEEATITKLVVNINSSHPFATVLWQPPCLMATADPQKTTTKVVALVIESSARLFCKRKRTLGKETSTRQHELTRTFLSEPSKMHSLEASSFSCRPTLLYNLAPAYLKIH
jgi:hypothetical protein